MGTETAAQKISRKKREVVTRFGGLAIRDILLSLFATCESSNAVCDLLGTNSNTLNRWLDKERIDVQYEHLMTPLDAVTQEPLTAPAAALAEVEAVIAAENRAKGGE